ncbi:hypothetical protein [Pimelobacter simplex]|uniref:hypothetical protein n=1 Tax=Nocardioides simplex TaxID=2045 RepID=UPI003AAB6B83
MDPVVWFVGADEGPADAAFGPDAFEQMSLEAAGSAAEEAAIREFWRGHRVVLMSVEGAYAYLATRTTDGAVVHGAEPEFEETTVVAASEAGLRAQVAGEVPVHPLVAGLIRGLG